MIPKPTYEDLEKRLADLKNRIAETRLSEEQLRESQDLYRALFDHAGVAIVLSDAETGALVEFNEKAPGVLGYSVEEFRNLDFRKYILSDREKMADNFKKILEHGKLSWTAEFRARDGTIKEFLQSAVIIAIHGKKYIHSILVDMTDHRNALIGLQKNEERYRSILESMEEGFYETDLEGNFTFFNPALFSISGYTAEELIGKNYGDYQSEAFRKKVFETYSELWRNNDHGNAIVQMEMIRKDGSPRMMETSVSLIRDASGKVTGFRGVSRDITERIRMEEAVRESEEMYRTLFEHSGFSMMLVDARTGKPVASNIRTKENLGYSKAEFDATGMQEFVVSRKEAFAKTIAEVLEKGSRSYMTRIRKKSGDAIEIFASAVKMKISGKTYIHVISVDITEERKAERQLRESEARFRAVFEAAADAIFLLDGVTGRILNANPAACLLFGLSPEAICGMTIDHLLYESAAGSNRKNPVKNRSGVYESVYVKDGKRIDVEVSSGRMEQEGGSILLNIVRNVTERKNIEKELDRYRQNLEEMVGERTRDLEAAQKELIHYEKLAILGQLTATVSHELRNPLGVIQSSNYFLRKKVIGREENIDRHLRRIDEQVMICDAIVGDLLEYTRGTNVDLAKDSLASWLPHLIQRIAESEKVVIESDIPADLKMIHHDRVKMQRVINNAINNAIQAVNEKEAACAKTGAAYMPHIALRVREDENGITITIRDNGIGMDPHVAGQAFEPLFTTRPNGTGLGLANVRKIMEEHGGTLSLESVPGKGTDLILKLLFKEAPARTDG